MEGPQFLFSVIIFISRFSYSILPVLLNERKGEIKLDKIYFNSLFFYK